MRDEIENLDSTRNNDDCFVMNLDDFTSPGTQWVAVNIVRGTTYYFDSFGLPPTKEIEGYGREPRFYNLFVFQKLNEVICGTYVYTFFIECVNVKKNSVCSGRNILKSSI